MWAPKRIPHHSIYLPALTATYTYDNEGRRTSLTYPHGRAFTYTYDVMGRPLTMMEAGDPIRPIVSNVTYNASGQITNLNGETRTYNERGQLTRQTGLGVDISYGFSASENDGRIQTRTDHLSGEIVQYQYDRLGRLTSAATQGGGGWGLAWNFDGFGNLTQQSVTKGQMTGFTLSVNGATNRINNQSYDANGNWGGVWSQSLGYDIDNRVLGAQGLTRWETYRYSARNERVVVERIERDPYQWTPPAPPRIFVHFYGIDGLLLSIHEVKIGAPPGQYAWYEHFPDKDRVYFGGRLMLEGRWDWAYWTVTDRLGSVVRKGNTNYKYAPYGQEIGGATTNDTVKFATYTRDSASGLDYALNRYYKPEWGRFTSPDPSDLNVRYSVPGSWNMYAYSDGDPINMYDPEGLGFWSAVGGFFKKIAGAVSDKTATLFASNGQDVAEADEGIGDPAGGDSGGGGGGVPLGIATSKITYPTFARQLSVYVPLIAGVAGPQWNVYFIPGSAYRAYQLCSGWDINFALGKFVSYGVLTTVNDTDIRKIIDATRVTNIPDGNANVSTSAAYYLGYGVTANPQGTAHGPLASVPGAGVGIGLHSSCGP